MAKSKKEWERITWGAVFGIILIWVGAGLSPLFWISDWPTRGQFGDMFGAVNALFSGLAFAGVVLAIVLQRQELSLQREELKMTREELKRSAEAQEKSEEALRKQAASLKTAARLSAITTLLQHIEGEIENWPDNGLMEIPGRIGLNDERKRLIADLKEIYEGKAD
ncbi:MAG: hypothetical protein IH614_19755 [Desulfuromonadales bacterium]|nr:hypothetical protein [Desulfuromonadales bacterium]